MKPSDPNRHTAEEGRVSLHKEVEKGPPWFFARLWVHDGARQQHEPLTKESELLSQTNVYS